MVSNDAKAHGLNIAQSSIDTLWFITAFYPFTAILWSFWYELLKMCMKIHFSDCMIYLLF